MAGTRSWSAPAPGSSAPTASSATAAWPALDSAHASLSLRLPTLISPRLSSSDPRERHHGLSHHTATLLELLLAAVDVAVPEGATDAASQIETASGHRHRLKQAPVDLDGYASSGLPASTMGRQLADDPLFFEAPLAAGALVAGVPTHP